MIASEIDEEILTADEAAAFLKMKKATLDKWRYRGIGPSYMSFGAEKSRIRYSKRALIAWLYGRTITPELNKEVA